LSSLLDMLRIEDALSLMLDNVPRLAAHKIPLEQSIGCVLREDIISDLDLPPFNRARMDGYALRAADTEHATPHSPITLKSIGDSVAGHAFNGVVTPGTAVRIMTGAPVPEGADAVEKIEVVTCRNDGTVEFTERVKLGRHISPIGSETQRGVELIKAGSRITPANSAVLASFGYAQPLVSRRPRVALISTGSELVDVAERPGPSQIRNSNTFSLAGYADTTGADVVSREIVHDDLSATREAIARAASSVDVVMLSGGVSMGDLDLVRPALVELGAQIFVERVAMHPGKPTVFAKLGDTVIFGLPGNPVSVAVAFHIFARPALLRMQGASSIELPRVHATMSKQVKGAPPRRSHQPARASIDRGKAIVEPVRWTGSSDLIAFTYANALIIVPEERSHLEEGEIAEVILLREL
jgi:molybdenum cofactor synthesis domain-containing protein